MFYKRYFKAKKMWHKVTSPKGNNISVETGYLCANHDTKRAIEVEMCLSNITALQQMIEKEEQALMDRLRVHRHKTLTLKDRAGINND